jgi:hypothetical protein
LQSDLAYLQKKKEEEKVGLTAINLPGVLFHYGY